jgi:hypothetical protein
VRDLSTGIPGVDPHCTWQRDGRKITQVRNDGRLRIWMLTDEYEYRGYRLGVWPD